MSLNFDREDINPQIKDVTAQEQNRDETGARPGNENPLDYDDESDEDVPMDRTKSSFGATGRNSKNQTGASGMKAGRAEAMKNKGPGGKFLMESANVGPNGTVRIQRDKTKHRKGDPMLMMI